MSHCIFSKMAFDLLVRRLTACNLVLKAIDDKNGIVDAKNHIRGNRVSSPLQISNLIEIIDVNVDVWLAEKKFADKSSPQICELGSLDKSPLLDVLINYQKWILYRERDKLSRTSCLISHKSTERAFQNLVLPELKWNDSLLSKLPFGTKDFGVSLRSRYPSLFSFLIFGYDISTLLTQKNAKEFVIQFDLPKKKTLNDTEDDDIEEDDFEESTAENEQESQSKPEPIILRYWKWGAAIAACAALILIVSFSLTRKNGIENSNKDFEISGNGNHVTNGTHYEIHLPDLDRKDENAKNGVQNLAPQESNLPSGEKVHLTSNEIFDAGNLTGTFRNSGSNVTPTETGEKTNAVSKIQFGGTISDGRTLIGIAGAEVRLSTGEKAIADENGHFELSVLKANQSVSRRIIISQKGYKPHNVEITVGEDADYGYNLLPE